MGLMERAAGETLVLLSQEGGGGILSLTSRKMDPRGHDKSFRNVFILASCFMEYFTIQGSVNWYYNTKWGIIVRKIKFSRFSSLLCVTSLFRGPNSRVLIKADIDLRQSRKFSRS